MLFENTPTTDNESVLVPGSAVKFTGPFARLHFEGSNPVRVHSRVPSVTEPLRIFWVTVTLSLPGTNWRRGLLSLKVRTVTLVNQMPRNCSTSLQNEALTAMRLSVLFGLSWETYCWNCW